MVTFPHAKINLGLHVLGNYSDRYHEIETCLYPIPWHDILEIIPADTFSFSCSGLPISGDPKNNLCVKAYQAMHNKYQVPQVKIHLHKLIPMQAGLGGGSADAAFTINTIDALFHLNLSVHQKIELASQLGSDIGFFFHSSPCIGRARGDQLEPIDRISSLENVQIVLIKPPVDVSTTWAYQEIVAQPRTSSIAQIISLPLSKWKNHLTNDFESVVFMKYPMLQTIKDKLYKLGAQYASLTGSGSGIYGLFYPPLSEARLASIDWSYRTYTLTGTTH